MFCHKQINAENLGAGAETSVNLDEIQKVVDRFNDETPINWERVYLLPDHVRFVHEAHLRFLTQAEVPAITFPIGDEEPRQLPLPVAEACSVCHGEVWNMEVVRPRSLQSLKMGTCVDCHRAANAPTDCSFCHK
jgi:hypothetical protein